MVKKKKNLYLGMLVAIMSLMLLFVSVTRASAADSDSGTVTDTIDYSFDGSTGALTLTGTGALPDCINGNSVRTYYIPWWDYRDEVKSITIGSGITDIGGAMFYGTGATKVTMANTVTSIGEYAFEYNDSLTSLTLSTGLTEISNGAFYDCTSLKSVKIPASVKKIDSCAFEFCSALTSLTLKSGLEKIGASAFSGCSNLASVTIPSTVTTIGSGAFSGTAYLENATATLIVGDGCLLKYVGTATSYTTPSSVKTICSDAFDGNTTLKKIVLSSSVTTIAEDAFMSMTNLASVTIPSSVTRIGQNAFTGTAYDDTLTGEFVILGGGVLYRYNGTATDLVIPSTVKSITGRVFYENATIETVVVPEGVTYIGDLAFMDCPNLVRMDLPSTITELGDYSIGYYYNSSNYATACSLSRLMLVGPACEATQAYCDAAGITYLTPESLQGSSDTINWSLDMDTWELTISGTGEVTSLNEWTKFQSVITSVVIEEGVTSLGSCALEHMSSLTSVTLPDSLTEIDDYAFYADYYLKTITIPAGVTSIYYDAFWYTGLTAINVAEGNMEYTSADGVLFNADMTKLITYPVDKTDESYVVPDTVTTIGYYSFCAAKLQKLTVPATVTQIDSGAFYSWTQADLIIFEGDVPSGLGYYSVKYNGAKDYIICYHASYSDWSTLISNLSSGTNITWKDLDTADKLKASSKKLTSGTRYSLILSDGSALTGYTFTSSKPAVAVVSKDGEVLACGNGTAVITATPIFAGNKLTCKITVSGAATIGSAACTAISADEASAIPENDYTYSNDTVGGYYYINSSNLYFQSFYSNKCEILYSFSNYEDSYINGDDLYVLTGDGYRSIIYRYNMTTQLITDTIAIEEGGECIGVDAAGNIYLFCSENDSYHISVYVDGVQKADGIINREMYDFIGFDSTNGNFYYEGYSNWRYWGYDHEVDSVYSGNYKDGVLTLPDKVVCCGSVSGSDISTALQQALMSVGQMYLYQMYWYDCNNAAAFYGNRYLIGASSLHGTTYVMYSNTYDPVTNEGASYTYDTLSSELDSSSAMPGANAVYDAEDDTFFIYRNDCSIEKVVATTGEVRATLTSSYKVIDMMLYGSKLVLIEKDDSGNYYSEYIDVSNPTQIVVSNQSMVVAESKMLNAGTDASYSVNLTYTSSNPKVVSVTSEGKLVAWSKGSAVITVKASDYGFSATATVTVTANDSLITTGTGKATLKGQASTNISDNNYSVWASTTNSYLYQKADGTYVRVEYLGSKKLLVEYYTASHTYSSSKTLTLPYELFGGFYHSSTGNYVVVGQTNLNESDSLEVVRVIKYNEAFTSNKYLSLKGINTYIPFDAGSCRMTETGGNLYIYTCHEMYDTGDGLHHQANMTFVVKESDMTLTDSYSDVMNISYGYISHSFNQFIVTDGEYIYRGDHGDASPRGLSYTKTSVDSEVTSPVSYGTVYGIDGYYGYNATGVSLGGMEVADNKIIYAANSVTMGDDYDAYGNRNIVLITVDKNTGEVTQKFVTKYSASSGVTVRTPFLVKIDDSHLILMWEAVSSAGNVYTKMVGLDSDGTLTTSIISTNYRLSDCQPIVNNDGLVTWYVSDGSTTTMYTVDPYNLAKSAYVATPSVTLSNVTSGVKVSWGSVSGATKYLVYRKVAGGSFSKLTTVTSSTLTYTDTTAVAGTTYYYTVKAYNGYAYSSYKTNVSIMRLTNPSVSRAAAATGVKVTWGKVTGATSYAVYYKAEGDKSYTRATKLTNGQLYYTITGLTNDKTYYFTVRAFNGSSGSSYTSTTKLHYLTAPTVTLSNTSSGVRVNWTKNTAADGYYVYRKTASGSWTRIAKVTNNLTVTYIDKTATNGVTYYYTVKAYQGSDMSGYVTNKSIKYTK